MLSSKAYTVKHSEVIEMKLIGYVRVSTKNQADNTSLESQKSEIEIYCQKFGHELVEVFCDVESGRSIKKRKGLQDAIASLPNYDGLIVAKTDRLGRATRDILGLIDDHILPTKKDLILLDFGIDTATPQGRLMLTVFSSFGEFERSIIKERTDKGRKIKMKEGKPMGTPKFGEVVIENTNERIVNEDELKVIEIIRKHRQSGKKANQIAKYLNAQGIPTKRGKQWSQQGVINILNRIYPKSA